MKDSTAMVLIVGFLLAACLLGLLGAAPIGHNLMIPVGSTYLSVVDSSGNEIGRWRVSDKAYLGSGPLFGTIITATSSIVVPIGTITTLNSGTANWQTGNASGTLSMTGTSANIALGSNYLSGDGGDEGISVDSSGKVSVGASTPIAMFDVHSSAYPTYSTLVMGYLGDTYVRSDFDGSGNSAGDVILQDLGGKVGIATGSPTNGVLEIGSVAGVASSVYGTTASFAVYVDRTEMSPDIETAFGNLQSMKPLIKKDGSCGVDYTRLSPNLKHITQKVVINRSLYNKKSGTISTVECNSNIVTPELLKNNGKRGELVSDYEIHEESQTVEEPLRDLTKTVSDTVLVSVDALERVKQLEEEVERLVAMLKAAGIKFGEK